LTAILDQLGIDRRASQADEGDLFWEKSIESSLTGSPLSVVVHCVGKAGNPAASNAATKLIERYHPKLMILSGIAAGRRDKVKIGDVVLALGIVDHTVTVAEDGKRQPRVSAPELPHVVRQMWQAFQNDENALHSEFEKLLKNLPEAPAGSENEYERHVARRPKLHDATVASADILLRDPAILATLADNVNQQVRAGEMEAAGFVSACQGRYPTVPWLVVRGISDFGDSLKNDEFHRMAACAAASFVGIFLRGGINISLLHSANTLPRGPTSRAKEGNSSFSQTPSLSEFEFNVLVVVGKRRQATVSEVASIANLAEERARFHLDELERKHRLLDVFRNMDRSIPDRYVLTHEGRRLLVQRGVFD